MAAVGWQLTAAKAARYPGFCMPANATTVWEFFHGWVFVAHCPGPLSEADLSAYLHDVMPREELKGVVVRASDGAPRPHQRAQIQRWFEQNNRRGAVLTDSVLARGGVTAMRWFGLPVRAFALDELDAALGYVGIQPADIAPARARLREVIDAADALSCVSA